MAVTPTTTSNRQINIEPPNRRWLLPVALGWSFVVLSVGILMNGLSVSLLPLYGLHDVRVGPACLGGFVAHAMLCESDKRRTLVLRIGFVLELVRFILVIWQGTPFDNAMLSVGYGFFAAAVGDFVIHREWRFAGLAGLVPLGMVNASFGLSSIVRRFTPLTYDGALYALDGTFSVPFSERAGEAFAAVPILASISLVAYALLPAALAAALGYEEYRFRSEKQRGVGVSLLLAYMVSGTVASLLYILCPGTGPAHAFRELFPRNLPDPSSVPLTLALFAPESPRNAMPSLHVAWAVIIARSVKGSRPIFRGSVVAYAVLTAIATIGSGEHYVVDLIAAVPFLVALEAITAHAWIPARERVGRALIALSLFAAWILAVKAAPSVVPFLFRFPAAVWVTTIVTVGVSISIALPAVQRRKHGSTSIMSRFEEGGTRIG